MSSSMNEETSHFSGSSISRSESGELNDIEKAIDNWGDAVFRLAMCRLKNRTDAEDVFQTVFLRLYLTKTTFSSMQHQKAWLLRVACNCCNDVFRNRTKQGNNTRSALEPEIGMWRQNYSHNNISIDESISAKDDLLRALNQLSDLQRTCIFLRYFEGYSSKEISKITGEKPSTVRSHLYRARAILRENLEGGN